jgi:hypothetical protein
MWEVRMNVCVLVSECYYITSITAFSIRLLFCISIVRDVFLPTDIDKSSSTPIPCTT